MKIIQEMYRDTGTPKDQHRWRAGLPQTCGTRKGSMLCNWSAGIAEEELPCRVYPPAGHSHLQKCGAEAERWLVRETTAPLLSPTLTFPSGGSIDWIPSEAREQGAFSGDMGHS